MSPLAVLGLLVGAAALFGWLSSRWLRIPNTVGTMLLTVTASMLLTALSGWFPALHSGAVSLVRRLDFEALILHGMLSLLLFAGAFLLDLRELFRQKLPVLVLSTVGTVLCASLVAVAMWLILPLLGAGASWSECLLFGALIAPTDPIAVLEMLKRAAVPAELQAQLAGESLFNDGVAAVLFLAALEAARGTSPSATHIGLLVLIQSGGGILIGISAAWLCAFLMRRVEEFQVDLLCSIALALGGYALADYWHLSAPLEAVVAGIALRYFLSKIPEELLDQHRMDQFWEVIDEVQNAVLFVLLGLEALAIRFPAATAETGLTAIFLVLAVRLIVAGTLLWAIRLAIRSKTGSVSILTWGGLRGGLSIALALAVPDELGRAWILATTYVVVVFSILVQGGGMSLFLRLREQEKNRRLRS